MSKDRKLIRGGTVVTVDRDFGVIPHGEVLIEDGVIVAIGTDLGATDVEIIDAQGGIIAPGTVDTHRHTWQAQLRGCCSDTSLQSYIQGFWTDATQSYTPEDARLGTYVGALEALDSGVTSLLDYAHITNTPEHADASVDGLAQSGIRGVFAYGLGQANVMAPPDFDRMADLARMASERFTGSGLLRLGAALSEIGLSPISNNKKQKQVADEHGAISTVHIGTSWASPSGLSELFHAGILDPRIVLAHGNTFSDSEWKLAGEAGVKISTTPESELAMGAGKLAINKVIDNGLKPTIGADVVSLNSGDIFTPTRQALAYTRWVDASKLNEQGRDTYVVSRTAAEALEWATINGAEALGLGRAVGSLSIGKQADIIVVGGQHIGVKPVNDAVGQLIFQTSPGQIDTVLVAGNIVKQNGKLVGVDLPALLARLEDSSTEVKERMARVAAAKTPMSPEMMAGFPKWIAHNLAS